MKKNCFSALYAAICVGLAFVVAACGSKEGSYEELSSIGSADDIVVVSGHASEIIRNAACVAGDQGITLSPALEKLIDKGASPREKDQIARALKVRGVDFDNCFLKLTDARDLVFAFGLTDADAFRAWMVDDMGNDEPEPEEGYDVYDLDSHTKIFANGASAYVVYRNTGECSLSFFNQLRESANAAPLQSWQAETLAQGKTCVMLVSARKFIEAIGEENFTMAGNQYYDIEAIKKGYAEITADLKGMKFNIAARFHGADGEVIKAKAGVKPINLSIFKYINKEDNMALALNLPGNLDWREVLAQIEAQSGGQLSLGSNKAVVDKIVEVLGNVDGTVFVSAHPKNLMLMASGPQYWDGTIGVEMKKGAAAGYIKEISALASAYGMTPSSREGSTVISLAPFTFYLKDIDGMFVLSTQPITADGGSILRQNYFKGQAAAFEATLADGTQLPGVAKLPFQPILALASDGETLSFDVELVGEGQYLLATLFGYIAEAFN